MSFPIALLAPLTERQKICFLLRHAAEHILINNTDSRETGVSLAACTFTPEKERYVCSNFIPSANTKYLVLLQDICLKPGIVLDKSNPYEIDIDNYLYAGFVYEVKEGIADLTVRRGMNYYTSIGIADSVEFSGKTYNNGDCFTETSEEEYKENDPIWILEHYHATNTWQLSDSHSSLEKVSYKSLETIETLFFIGNRKDLE